MVCRTLNFPERSRQAHFIRELVRVWLGKNGWMIPPSFDENKCSFRFHAGQRELLDAFDLPFRRRRLRALVDAANSAYDKGCCRRDLDDFKRRLAEASDRLDRIEEEAQRTIGCCLRVRLRTPDIDREVAELQKSTTPKNMSIMYDAALKTIYRRVAVKLSKGC